MKRLTRKELDEIRRVYHMDLPKTGCQRYDEKTGSVYACHIYIEKLVNEIEAFWRARKKKSKGQAGSRNGAKTVVRLLRAGDIIQKGDEYKPDMLNAEWLPVPDQYWNLRYSRASFRPMRRPSVNRRLV